MSQGHDRSEGPGGGPAEVIAAMSRATDRRYDSRPSMGGRSGPAGDVSQANGAFQSRGLLANFKFLPSLLPVGYLNPVSNGPAPPLHNGLVQRVFVRQVFHGWDQYDPSAGTTTYNTQPEDAYSKKLIMPLPEAAGAHYSTTIAVADRN